VGGRDFFVFGPGSGLDAIFDVEPSRDRIDVSGYGIERFGQLELAGNGTPAVEVSFDAANGVQVQDLASAPLGLGAGDFIFA
jgi:hypothetical protein